MAKYPLTVTDEIEAFLMEHRGRRYCVKCINLAIGLKKTTNTRKVVRKLGCRTEFVAKRGECSACYGKLHVVIRAK